jgi:hypothetical protein
MVNHDPDVAATEVLAGLRAALDPDPERAGQKYALLRRKLVNFFEWRGATSPEACADEARVTAAWRMTDGAPAQSVSSACATIARSILETQGRELHEEAGAHGAAPPAPDRPGDREALLQACETSLDALPAESRELIVTYFAGDSRQMSEGRNALARQLGLPLNQLRLRAHRTRAQFEQAVMGLTPPSSTDPS